MADQANQVMISNIARTLAQRIGERAFRAADRAAGGRPWTSTSLQRASEWLRNGDRRAGVRRPWPHLAEQLYKLAYQMVLWEINSSSPA